MLIIADVMEASHFRGLVQALKMKGSFTKNSAFMSKLVYDPEGYELMKHIYPEKTLPEPWHYNVNIYDIDGKPYKSYDENMKFNWDFIQ